MRERYTFGDVAFACLVTALLAVGWTGECVERVYEYAPLLQPWVTP